MNGKDGSPLRLTRGRSHASGKASLRKLNEAAYKKRIVENRTVSEDEARSTAAW
ncbi:MAG: hypothetical protein ACLR0U_18600 [Enterocloster clostridioformis]